MNKGQRILALCLFLGTMFWTSTARADVVAIGQGAFPASPLITFTGLATGTEVNGLTVSGVVSFTYSLGNGNLVIDGGPGITNNINPPNIVSIGNETGILTVHLGGLVNQFGYGYAVLSTVNVANATTITLFNGATNVGSLSYNGVLDPTFAGGFAGIQSTLLFDTVQLTFNSVAAPAFALDNIRFATTATTVPEPTSMVLFGSALAFFATRIRKRRNHEGD